VIGLGQSRIESLDVGEDSFCQAVGQRDFQFHVIKQKCAAGAIGKQFQRFGDAGTHGWAQLLIADLAEGALEGCAGEAK